MNPLDHIEAIIIHADWTPAGMNPPLDIPSVHIDENGWDRSGYVSHILHDGTVVDLTLSRDVAYTSEDLQAIPWTERAAISPRYHTVGWNGKSLGICLAGGKVKAPESAGYTWGDTYSIAQCNVLGDELVRIWGEIGRRTDVLFHREAQADRQCPGVEPIELSAEDWMPVIIANERWDAIDPPSDKPEFYWGEPVIRFSGNEFTSKGTRQHYYNQNGDIVGVAESGLDQGYDAWANDTFISKHKTFTRAKSAVEFAFKGKTFEAEVLSMMARQIELLESIERNQRK